MKRLTSLIKKIDGSHLEFAIPFLILLIVSPILYLYKRDGMGSGVFPFHDQLDETILNYVFTAKYMGKESYEQMFGGGIPSVSLKPFCVLFVPLYKLFSVYVAFTIQYVIVISTAFLGMYYCLKIVFKTGSISALGAGFLFAFLPVHSIYGNVVAGTPFLIFCIYSLCKRSKHKVIPCLGLICYALSTSFALVGWAVVGLSLLGFIIQSIRKKKPDKSLLLATAVLLTTYVLCNFDLILETFGIGSFVSHRSEFGLGDNGDSFIGTLKEFFLNESYQYEAESKHIMVFVGVVVALAVMLVFRSFKKYFKNLLILCGSIIAITLVSTIFHMDFIKHIQENIGGMFSSFNFERFYYFLPGLWYLLLGFCGHVIINSFKERFMLIALLLMLGVMFVCFYHLAKDKNGIFYQNINQINNGEAVTGYLTMKNIYAESLMEEIDEAIGRDKSTYRVVHIGISPVVSLINGFYTVDGYSNNYPLEYKQKFREVITGELELNDYNKAYFDGWGNRCYAFYHEWGNAYLLKKGFSGKIDDLRLNMDKLKELDCEYIFSAGEILNPEKYGLKDMGYFENEDSYWGIFVYEVE